MKDESAKSSAVASPQNHPHVRIREPIAERGCQIRVDLDSGEAGCPGPEHVGREPRPRSDLDDVRAEVDPSQGFREDRSPRPPGAIRGLAQNSRWPEFTGQSY